MHHLCGFESSSSGEQRPGHQAASVSSGNKATATRQQQQQSSQWHAPDLLGKLSGAGTFYPTHSRLRWLQLSTLAFDDHLVWSVLLLLYSLSVIIRSTQPESDLVDCAPRKTIQFSNLNSQGIVRGLFISGSCQDKIKPPVIREFTDRSHPYRFKEVSTPT